MPLLNNIGNASAFVRDRRNSRVFYAVYIPTIVQENSEAFGSENLPAVQVQGGEDGNIGDHLTRCHSLLQ
jgi:hypothetical protein